MQLNIAGAPTSPRTTRSSYVNQETGKVVNHNIQITFSNFSFARPLTKGEANDTHNVHVGLLDPSKVKEETIKAIKFLIKEDCLINEGAKFALVWHQVVGKENNQFDAEPTVFELDWLNTNTH